jgi:6-phosphogluconolactonase
MTLEILVDSRHGLVEACAARFEEAAGRAVAERGRFAVALPGGSVAITFFPRLARAGLDGYRTEFFWGDERAVALSDPESNYWIAENLWLAPARVPAARVHRMPAEAEDLEGAAAAYAGELETELGTPPRLDVALLGMGPDGHVCSLFPRHPLLQEERRWVAAILDSPKPPRRRLTLTLPVLHAADLVIVAAMGEAKAEAVREAIEDPASTLPVALALRGARRALLMLDDPAAHRLSRH